MKIITNLIEKCAEYRDLAINQKHLENSTNNTRFNKGDIIEFNSGFNNDIRYVAEVAGIDNKDIYVVWTCYWSPIRDDTITNIKLHG